MRFRSILSAGLLAWAPVLTGGSFDPTLALQLGVRFGGEAPPRFSGLLQLDHDRRHVEPYAPPVAQLVLGERGATVLSVSGLPVLYRATPVLQASPEEDGATPGETFWGIGKGTAAVVLAGGIAAALILAETDYDNPAYPPDEPYAASPCRVELIICVEGVPPGASGP